MTPESKPPQPPEKERIRIENIALAILTFLDALSLLEVKDAVIGLAPSRNPEGAGYMKCSGDATMVLNLLAGLIHTLRPEDFKNLLVVMEHGDYFADHRAAMKIGPAPDATEKKEFVN